MTDRDMSSGDVTEAQSETLHKALLASCSSFEPPIIIGDVDIDGENALDLGQRCLAHSNRLVREEGQQDRSRTVQLLRQSFVTIKELVATFSEVEPAIQAARQAGINEGLEMAAKVAEAWHADMKATSDVAGSWIMCAASIASQIRALKVEK